MKILKETIFEDELFTGLSCSDVDLSDRIFRDCQFVDCDFSGSKLSKCQFSDCEFKQCNFSNAKLYGTKLSESDFIACKMDGIDFTTCNQMLFSINLNRCKIAFGIFAGLQMSGSNLSGSALTDCLFEETDLSRANLSKCDFQGATFDHTNLTGADLRNATGYSINPNTNKVATARFSYPEVLSLLQPLGIVVE